MMKNYKAPFYMGGGTETELVKFNLQRFATVDNPYIDNLEERLEISSLIKKALVSLTYYARDNIANYQTITTIPQENIEYLSGGLAASSCICMFENCKQLTSIPWNEFDIDTSKVTNMTSMFQNCEALTSLNLSSFDTSKVTNMRYMFYNCIALTSLDLSNFDTSKVTNMSSIFNSCNALTSLNLSSFDTSQVTSMFSMFNSCNALKEIICPNGFDMSSCTDVYRMFFNCDSYSGDPLHFKNVPRDLDFSDIGGTKGTHYVIDNYKT